MVVSNLADLDYHWPAGLSAYASFDPSRRNPEHPRRGDGIDGPYLREFVSEAMDVPVMGSAQGHRNSMSAE
jgi:hypothetical protein